MDKIRFSNIHNPDKWPNGIQEGIEMELHPNIKKLINRQKERETMITINDKRDKKEEFEFDGKPVFMRSETYGFTYILFQDNEKLKCLDIDRRCAPGQYEDYTDFKKHNPNINPVEVEINILK